MKNEQEKQRVQENISIQNQIERDPYFWQIESLDITLAQMIYQQLPPFIITQPSPSIQDHHCSEPEDDQGYSNLPQTLFTYNRKQKSLSELTKKFIEKFEGTSCPILALDQVTQEMKVERRRIYDIINIMESLNVVSKIKKNIYKWKGLREAIKTINIYSRGETFQNEANSSRTKKQRSLEGLATQFLKVFSQNNKTLTLQEASFYLMNESNDETKKTKVRRLYDIVNVFKCLGLVRKVKTSGAKPAYEWLGCEELQKIICEKEQATPIQTSTYAGEELSQIINSQFSQIETRIYEQVGRNLVPEEQEESCEGKDEQQCKIQNSQKYALSQKQNNKQVSFEKSSEANEKQRKQTLSTVSIATVTSPRESEKWTAAVRNSQIMPRTCYFSRLNKSRTSYRLSRARSYEVVKEYKPIQEDSETFKRSNKKGFMPVKKQLKERSQSYFNSILRMMYQETQLNTLDEIIDKFNENLWGLPGKNSSKKENLIIRNNVIIQ